jgi:hypothetical protein
VAMMSQRPLLSSRAPRGEAPPIDPANPAGRGSMGPPSADPRATARAGILRPRSR